jgi:glycine cleavage system aminomethyltransferase T
MSDSYQYKVRDKSGNLVTGTLVADNERLVLERLREMGYTPLEVGKEKKGLNLEINIKPAKIKLKEVAIFSRQFATMVNSGLPILRALSILSEQVSNKELAKILTLVRNDVEQGASLSAAMAKYPKAFNNLYIAMVKSGETGGMLDDGTVFRLGADNFRWVGADDYDGIWLREQAEKLGLRVWVKSSTDQIHNLSVQGPKSRDILKQVVWTPPDRPNLEELGWFRFTVGRIGDFNGKPILVSRTGYTGELGYEVWCHPKDGLTVWDAIWEAGRPHGLTPLGLEALDMLRIESGLVFSGFEFNDQIDPFEAGIGFAVDLANEEDFVGRKALVRRRDSPQRVLVGLELVGNERAVHGDCVHAGRSQVGVITSGTRSPMLKSNIALCRVAIEYAEPGTEVEVGKLDGHQKRIPATVVRLPFYDPGKKRPRS